jgi:AcrR family transcriptional regulator
LPADALPPAAPRPLRADARRNHGRVLDAARAAFAEVGLDVPMEDVARRAGVGVGTLYRHFPTKDALVAALTDAHFERLAEMMERAADAPGDPWTTLIGALRAIAAATAEDTALCEIIARRPIQVTATAAGQERLEAAIARLLTGAHAGGAMREDARVEDVRNIMCGFGHIAAQQRAGADLDWRRYLTVALDGLRAR